MSADAGVVTSNGGGSRTLPCLEVSLAALYRKVDGRTELLVARRHASAVLGGLWEFPGGKIELGEQPEAAARREVEEEVGLTADAFLSAPCLLAVVEPAAEEPEGAPSVRLHAYIAEVKPNAMPQALGASEVRWIGVDELAHFPWPKANAAINRALAERLG